MPTYLFRGVRKDNQEKIFGCLLEEPSGRSFIGTYAPTGRIWNYEEVEPESVALCSGVSDKNGQMIFEGDRGVVTRIGILEYGKITFKHGTFWFVSDGVAGMISLHDLSINGYEIEIREYQKNN